MGLAIDPKTLRHCCEPLPEARSCSFNSPEILLCVSIDIPRMDKDKSWVDYFWNIGSGVLVLDDLHGNLNRPFAHCLSILCNVANGLALLYQRHPLWESIEAEHQDVLAPFSLQHGRGANRHVIRGGKDQIHFRVPLENCLGRIHSTWSGPMASDRGDQFDVLVLSDFFVETLLAQLGCFGRGLSFKLRNLASIAQQGRSIIGCQTAGRNVVGLNNRDVLRALYTRINKDD